MASSDDPPEILNVRQTAQILGVHENTVRNWARKGILASARVPGSGFNRFFAADVERLRQERGAPAQSITSRRRTVGPELVDATQVATWADAHEARAKFPELMRRLLAATPGVTDISVRAGEGVALGGWDGHAHSAGAPSFLPSGSLWFEFGAGARPAVKAQQDWEKRCADPLAAEPGTATFVFVTPRRWADAKKWASARAGERVFRDVRALDADDLEGWLQATPAVHAWFSEQLGRNPRELETLERWWSHFSARTQPQLPAELFLAGRTQERESLVEALAEPSDAERESRIVTVSTEWREEAIAFVYGALTVDTPTEMRPTLVVHTAAAWDRVTGEGGRTILVPLFPRPDLAAAQENGHHVVLAVGRDELSPPGALRLPRPDRLAAAKALDAAGVDSAKAHDLAGLARRSMPSLVRALARNKNFARPPWSIEATGAILAPLVLVGSWTSRDEDQQYVGDMTDQPYDAVEQILMRWAQTDDPPFIQSNAQWHLASSFEAFLLLRERLTKRNLVRWHAKLVKLLTEVDPTLSLTMEDRPLAGLRGVRRTNSDTLRRGVAEGVAMMGAGGPDALADGTSPEDHAGRAVTDVLSAANLDRSGRVWQSLAAVLPLLAEAAPVAFLDAVHEDLDRGGELLRGMFQDAEQSSWLSSSSPHTGLLWALETVAWSSTFFTDASRALARLQAIDPGGRLSNRPIESLSSILVGWIRHTSASLDQRLEVIELICREQPEVGWDLLLRIWPSRMATSSPPHPPRYRDWTPDDKSVLISDWALFVEKIASLALGLTGEDPNRWATLSEQLGDLPPSTRDRLIDALSGFVESSLLDADGRKVLWERLRAETAKHRRFPNAEWSMTDAPLARLEKVAEELEPSEDPTRFAYLFDWRPDIDGADESDWAGYEEVLAARRAKAVREILADKSLVALKQLARESPVPEHLGWTLGDVAPEALTGELLTWLDNADQKIADVASGWAQRKLASGDTTWLRSVLRRPEMSDETRRLRLALQAVPRAEVWDALRETDPDLSTAYWNNVAPRRVGPHDAARAVAELLTHERAWDAIGVLSSALHRQQDDPETTVTPALVNEVLSAARVSAPSEGQRQMLGYEIGVLLDYLEAEHVDAATIAGYEFAFFTLLEHNRRPRALSRALGDNPDLFVELVSRVYRGSSEPARELGERESALALQSWRVIRDWNELPGLRDDAVDGPHLTAWVNAVRSKLGSMDRGDIGDEVVGEVLSASPAGADGIWPAEAVRQLVEEAGSQTLESGLQVGLYNRRGGTSRGVFDGGKQEWDLAARYREWAAALSATWPRTSRLLRRVAEGYERDAKREDAEAALRADTE